jgi:hypothetical protein
MRRTASGQQEQHLDNKAARREQLKKLSEDKMQHWPNTLEANRLKKLRFVEDKARREEEARQELDREEAEHRRIQRLESIKRANTLMYEQTDKMKYLKGAKMYADTVATRAVQVEVKAKRKQEEKVREAAHHQVVLKQVADGEIEEKEKEAKIAAKIEVIKAQRREQVEEVRAKRAAEIAEAKAIGEAMKREAAIRIQDDLDEQVRKQERIAAANAATVVANERIKVIKAELSAREQAQMDNIAVEKEQIEGRKIAMKALEIRRFEKKQETRQRMIDRAVELLAAKNNAEQAIATKQANEQRAKEDAAIELKAATREAERIAIYESRQAQMLAKKEKLEKEWAEEDRMVAAMKVEKERGEKAEHDKMVKEHENIARLKKLQYNEAAKTQRNRIAERLEDINRAKLLHDIGGQDDTKFAEVCKEQIKQYAAAGKPVYTLLKALEQVEPVLIPARLDHTKRGQAFKERDA